MTKVKRFPKKKGKKKAQNVKKQELEKKDPHVDDAEEKTVRYSCNDGTKVHFNRLVLSLGEIKQS